MRAGSEPTRRGTRRLTGAALLVLAAAALAGQAVRPLTDTTEARYAEVAREMLRSGDWLTPTLEGIPHLTKPPLVTWLMAGSMAVFGVNAWGARVPGILALLIAAFLVGRVARYLGRPEAEGWGAAMFGVSAGGMVAALVPSTDMVLTAWEVGAAAAYLAHRRGVRGARLAFFAALGGAFLTKGPPGLLIPVAVVVGDRLRRPGEPQRPLFRWWPGWLVFAVLGFGWYGAIVAGRPETARWWIGSEVVGRVFSSEHGREQTPLVYPLALAAGLFPWWVLVPGFLGRRLPGFARSWRTGARPILLAWCVVPLVVFTISKSRLPSYALPILPAMILALALDRPRARDVVPGRWFGIHPAAAIGYAALVAAFSWASVPLAQGRSWKKEALVLRERVPEGGVELIAFRQSISPSLAFYLAPDRERLYLTGAGPDPAGALAGDAAAWAGTPAGNTAHVFLTSTSEERALAALPGPPPELIGEKRRVRLWYQPPISPGSRAPGSAVPDSVGPDGIAPDSTRTGGG
jgi:4-amino-4-deoxy-L-arabinose transferase-like glycosyltransferase